jgi:hypothetical protein
MPKKKTTEEFIQDAIKIHGDKYDYSKVEYINSKTKVIIICKEHECLIYFYPLILFPNFYNCQNTNIQQHFPIYNRLSSM